MIAPPEIQIYNAVEAEAEVRRNLDAFFELLSLGRSTGTHVIIVFVPSFPPSKDYKYWRMYEEQLPSPLDLRESLANDAYFRDGVHLSLAGHERVAQEISEELIRSWSGVVGAAEPGTTH
jgi:hypothetical protein